MSSSTNQTEGPRCKKFRINFDGYTNSIYSVTVGAVDFRGQHPKYSEACAANMVVAYSSGSGQHIVTTDRGKDECALVHGGTSAAAPNVAGVFALALQARPDLTWRDIQYLCVETACQINPKDRDWERTATGRYYSYKYGYGVLDASLYVQRALTWKLVKPQAWLETPTIQLDGGTLDAEDEWEGGTPIGKEGVKSKMTITKQMMQDANLESLEHVTIKVWIDHTRRGDVEVAIVSPNGIRSVLAGARERDDSMSGFPGWTFMSVKHWGEDPVGDWTIHVTDQQSEVEEGAFLGWNMILWGTTIDPSKAKFYEMDPMTAASPRYKDGSVVQSAVGELIPTGDAPVAAAVSSSSGPQPSVQQQPRNLVESSEEEEDDEDDDDEDDEDEDEDDEESSEEDSGSQQPLQQNQVRRPGEVDSSASLI